MDPRNAAERAEPKGPGVGDPEAIEFVRFCYRRRRVGWPELYDEMCAVAGRGLYRGYDADDLSTIGIGFALYQMPSLAGIVQQVVAEDLERRRLCATPVRAVGAAAQANREPVVDPVTSPALPASSPAMPASPATEIEIAEPRPRLVAVAVGA